MFKRLFKRRPKKAKSYVTPPTAPTYTMSRAGGGEAEFEVGPDLFKDLKKAACAGNVKLGLAILKQEADVVNQADRFGRTALIHATMWHRDEFIKMLLAQPGINVAHRSTGDHNTALHLAAFNGNIAITKLLLVADPAVSRMPGEFGMTPAERADANGHPDLGTWLRSEGAKLNEKGGRAAGPAVMSPSTKSSVNFSPSGEVVIGAGTTAGVASHQLSSLIRDTDEKESAVHFTDVYSISKRLGEGAFATVYKVVHKTTGGLFAMKEINLRRIKSSHTKDMLMREIKLMKLLDHPNIIKIVEVFRQANMLYLVMECCEGGELFDDLYDQPAAKYNEEDANKLLRKMVGALAYMHANGLVHRDLKLENFIFTDKSIEKQIKLIDFGFSRAYLEGDTMSAFVGTSYYIAPEVLAGRYTAASDLWSLGVIAFMMLTGQCPFGGKTDHEIMENVKLAAKNPTKTNKKLHKILQHEGMSRECVDFVMGMLQTDIPARLTCPQALEHPWLTGRSMAGMKTTLPERVASETEPGRRRDTLALVSNVKAFRDQSRLKRTALLAISFGANSKELRKLAAQFAEFDTNGDGLISPDEFTAMMAKNGIADKAKARTYFDAVDQDGTGMIKYSEFIAAAMAESHYSATEQIEAAFRRLDLDDSGEITLENLVEVLGPGYDVETVKQVLDEGDYMKDGVIRLAEFKTALGMEVVC